MRILRYNTSAPRDGRYSCGGFGLQSGGEEKKQARGKMEARKKNGAEEKNGGEDKKWRRGKKLETKTKHGGEEKNGGKEKWRQHKIIIVLFLLDFNTLH